MPPTIVILNPLHDIRWNRLSDSSPHGTIYHSQDWLNVIASTYPHVTPMAFALGSGTGLQAALPAFLVKSRLTGTRLVSLPFTSYCNPLCQTADECASLIEAAIRYLPERGAAFYEIRTLGSALPESTPLKKHDYHMTHILNLEGGFAKVRKSISSNIVTNKNRAVKAGIVVREAASETDLRKFYAVHAVTRRKQGFPIQPYSFFKNMFELMGPPGHVRFLLAELNGAVVAGIVLFQHRKTVSYEIGASLPEFLEARPNHLLLWKAVETACEEGRQFFDFGKSPPDNPGLIEFKRRWGAVARECPYYYYPEVAGVMAVEQNTWKHRAVRFMYRHTPLSVAQLLGRSLYRHLG